MESDPFIGAALASFDLACGVQILEKWILTDKPLDVPLESLFRTILSNVHRQKEETYSSFVTSTIEIESCLWLIVTTIFGITQNQRKIFYAIPLIFRSNYIVNFRSANKVLSDYSIYLATAAKSYIQSNTPLKKIGKFIQPIKEQCISYFQSSIYQLPKIDIFPSDSRFYSLVLSSHLSTQMITVIESSNDEETLKLAGFLANFLLPNQLEHSSLQINEKIIPGLFLQCVKKQNIDIVDIFLSSPNPITFVRMSERKVYTTNAPEKQIPAYKQTVEASFLEDITKRRRLTAIKAQYKNQIVEITTPAPWITTMISILMQMPESSHSFLCKSQFDTLIRICYAFMNLVDEKTLKGINALTQDNMNEIIKELKLTGKDDAIFVASMSQLFDPTIIRKITLSRR